MQLYRALGRNDSKDVKLRLLFDSRSIDKRSNKLSSRASALLKYRLTTPLVFRRTPFFPYNALLKEIPEIRFNDKNGQRWLIAPEAEFGIRPDFEVEVDSVIKRLKKESTTEEEREVAQLVCIQETLNSMDTDGFLVTEDNFLLSHRLELEKMFSPTPLNIVNTDEMAEYVDLTFKYNSQYLLSHHTTTSENLWYWYSFRVKVPHYHVDFNPKAGKSLEAIIKNSMMDGFSQRAGFLLTAIDEMGFQHHSGVTNTSQAGMIYHFNYFILLMTGIYDSLALQTMDKYKLTFEDSNNPMRISLNPNNGKEFLKALKVKDLPLRMHIQNNCDVIKAPYLLRELIAHREGLRPMTVDDNGWKANLIAVPKDFVDCLKRLGDSKKKFVKITDFGVYANYLLEPYTFSKEIATRLFVFCDTYIELLGYPNFVEELPKDGSPFSFSDMIAKFKEDNLGF